MTLYFSDKKLKNPGAFSLIEILVAVAIFSVVSVSLYQSFRMGILSYRRTESYWHQNQKAIFIMDMITKDIKNSFAYSNDNKDSRFSGDGSKISFYCLLESYKGYNPSVNIAFVKYEFSEKSLKKTSYSSAEAFADWPLTGKKEDFAIALKDFKLSYGFREKDEDKTLSWVSSWEPSDEKSVPWAVEVELSAEDDVNKRITTFKKTILIPVERDAEE